MICTKEDTVYKHKDCGPISNFNIFFFSVTSPANVYTVLIVYFSTSKQRFIKNAVGNVRCFSSCEYSYL